MSTFHVLFTYVHVLRLTHVRARPAHVPFSPSQLVAMYSSSYVLLTTALDRYVAILHPLSTPSWTTRRINLLVLTAWGVSCAFSIPQLVIFRWVQTLQWRHKFLCPPQNVILMQHTARFLKLPYALAAFNVSVFARVKVNVNVRVRLRSRSSSGSGFGAPLDPVPNLRCSCVWAGGRGSDRKPVTWRLRHPCRTSLVLTRQGQIAPDTSDQ